MPPLKKTRTKKFSNKFHFMLWDYPSTASNVPLIEDDPYDLFDHPNISFISRIDISNPRKPNGDAEWDTLTSYSAQNIFKKGNAFNCGHRLADNFEFFGYTNDYRLWRHRGKNYAGGIYLQNWGASHYPVSGGKYIGKSPFHTESADKINYQGRTLSVGYSSAARASIGKEALNSASDNTELSLTDFIRHSLQTMKNECDARNLAYPAYCAWDFESQIGWSVGTTGDQVVQDVRSDDIYLNNIATGDGLDGGTATAYALHADTYTTYVGGNFTSVNGVAANNIAKFESSSGIARWLAIGSGLSKNGLATNATVRDIVSFGGFVYVCGSFDSANGVSANNVARFSGNTWTALGDGFSKNGSASNATVYTVVVYNNKIYFGGDFDKAGNVAVNNIAMYDPSTNTWSAVNGGVNGVVYALTTYRKRAYLSGNNTTDIPFLIIGGSFSKANNLNDTNNVAAYHSTNGWFALGKGVDGTVYSLCEMDRNFDRVQNGETNITRNLVIAGSFTGGINADNATVSSSNIVRWTPDTTLDTTVTTGKYYSLDGGTDGVVRVVLQPNYSLDLFAGGEFNNAGGSPRNKIARFDISTDSWKAINDGFDGNVYCMASQTINGQFIGGSFTNEILNGEKLNGLCKFGDHTRFYDIADIVINNKMIESPNRYETEIVYEEYNTKRRRWEGKTFKDVCTEANFPAHTNSNSWQNTIIRDPKSYIQSSNRDFLRKMYPYFAKINDWVLHKILYSVAKEIFPGIRCGNYSQTFPLNGDINNYYPEEPRSVFYRVPHESSNLEQRKRHFRADFQVPVCYSQRTDAFTSLRNATTTQIATNNGLTVVPTQDAPAQFYYDYHPFGTTNKDIYRNINKQRIKALTALKSETSRFTNLTCIPYGEPPYENSAASDFPSYAADETDILDVWKYWYTRGVRTVFLFNPSMTYYGGNNSSKAATSVYGNNLSQSRLFCATVDDLHNWISAQISLGKKRTT